MWVRSSILRVCCSFVLMAALASLAFADTIRLKDGSLIKGHIVSFGRGSFVVEIGEGTHRKQLTFAASEIESINFDTSQAIPQSSVPTNRTASYTSYDQRNSLPPVVITTNRPASKSAGVTTTQSSVRTAPSIVPSNETSRKPAIITSSQTSAKPAANTPAEQPRNIEPQPRPINPALKAPPVAWNVKVLADNTNNGWTNSGWVVRKGQRIRITGDGTVSLGNGQTSPPSGVAELNDDTKLLKGVPTGALIAVIGDDNNDFIYVGATREFTAKRDGPLFLGVNEGRLDDNSGAYNVKIEILPDNEN